jgi:nicotinate-nucleotide pyrophosphorylase
MKLFLFLMIFITHNTLCAAQKQPIDNIIEAFKTSSSNTLASYMDNNVEITLPDKNDNYTKAQATAIVKDFFNNNTVKNFVAEQKGNKNGILFCIGTLTTQTGNFKVTVYLQHKNEKYYLQEIRIESKK